ncbi:MarC family protein [Xanthobacter autotrophicus DSM 597]|uniref:MarC family protein n=1 Tax=Xanthobacter TaxID=279 RepID=UPI001AEB81D5|nr:MarC family protein [Xanthobacter flavus]MBP2152203.1 multiple antibiotic resistance protein [Xanthobacter flavus]
MHLTNAVNIFITVFAALFPIVNPLGTAPIFLTFVRRCSPQVRERVARSVAIYGFLLLLGSLAIGAQILLFFGISLPVLRIAGGMVVAVVGWNILHEDENATSVTKGEELDEARAQDEAFYPLTLPLTVGPGSIAATVALAAGHTPTWKTDPLFQLSTVLGAVAGLLAVALTVYFSFREAPTLERVLGKTGTNVLVRLFAFILFAIGVQIIWMGVHALIMDLPR